MAVALTHRDLLRKSQPQSTRRTRSLRLTKIINIENFRYFWVFLCSLYVSKFWACPSHVLPASENFAQALQKLKSNFKDTPLTSSKLETTIIVVCWTRDATLKQTCPNFGISVDTTILTLTFTKNKSKWFTNTKRNFYFIIVHDIANSSLSKNTVLLFESTINLKIEEEMNQSDVRKENQKLNQKPLLKDTEC